MIIEEMKKIVNEFKEINPNMSDLADEYLKKEIKELCKSLEDTIYFLKNADEETICFSCTIWDEVARYFKSKELVNCMKNCAKRFPNSRQILEINIDYAEKELK